MLDLFCAIVVCLFVLLCILYILFFKQKTAYEMRISDWSSDVCSSDLLIVARDLARRPRMDRQHRARRRRRLVAKPRAMGARGDLRRRPPARPRDPAGRKSVV